jgi:hypothetical protein
MVTMTDITATAAAARENARQDSGRFGAQEHRSGRERRLGRARGSRRSVP